MGEIVIIKNIPRISILVATQLVLVAFASFATWQLGAAEYGKIAYVMASANIILVIVLLGFDQIIIRDAKAGDAFVIIFAYFFVTTISIFLCAIFYIYGSNLYLSALLANGIGIFYIISATMQTLQKFTYGLFCKIFIPVFIVVVSASVVIVISSEAGGIKSIGVSAILLTIMANAYAIFIILSLGAFENFPDRKEFAGILIEKLHDAIYMCLFSAGFVIANQADVVMLGQFGEPDSVGWYAVASRFVMLTTLGHIVVASVIPRQFAEHFNSPDFKTVRSQIGNAVKFSSRFYFSTLILLSILFTWIYPNLPDGRELILGPAIILSIAAAINIFTGPCGFALTMSKNHKTAAIVSGVGAFSNVVLNYFLIPHYQGIGAAIATLISMGGVYITLAYSAFEKTNINTTILSRRVWR